jgi:deoxyadenosine/deoxycytidine kinase
MGKLILAPDLIIYLRASIPTLVQQIQKRGRDYEDSIRLDYLKQLNQRYEAWATRYRLGKMLVINIDELNFADNKGDMSKVIDRIDAQLHGLF